MRSSLWWRGRIPVLLTLYLVTLSFVASGAYAAQVTAVWKGGAGNWSDPGKWSNGTVPDNGRPANTTYAVRIERSDAQVILDQWATIDSLSISSSCRLTIADGNVLAVKSGIVNAGTLALDSVGSSLTGLRLDGNVTLSGGGTVTMSDSVNNYIFGAVGNYRLTNLDNNITGSGQIGMGSLSITNQGTITSQGNAGLSIFINWDGAINRGTLRAAGGTLVLGGSQYDNRGGVVRAQHGSRVELSAVDITGGSLISEPGSDFQVLPYDIARLSSLSFSGTYIALNGSRTILKGSIHNRGIINLLATADQTDLWLDGPVTLNGGGQIAMSDHSGNRILGGNGYDGSGRLDNIDNTIKGSGQIGCGSTTIINRGVIQAAGKSALMLYPDNGGIINSASIEAVNGSTLWLLGGWHSQYFNANGQIKAEPNSQVLLVNVRITGGLLSGAGNFVNVFYSSLDNLTLAAELVSRGEFLSLSGTIENRGRITLTSLFSTAALVMDGDVTLTGGGRVTLFNGPTTMITGMYGTEKLINQNNTISGSGQLGYGQLGIVNRGTIVATDLLKIDTEPFHGFTNEGMVIVNSGCILRIASTSVFKQTSGVTTVNGRLEAPATVALQGGTLQGRGRIVGNIDNSSGTVAPGPVTGRLIHEGRFTQSAGTLNVDIRGSMPGTDYDVVTLKGPLRLDGTLNVNLQFPPSVGSSFTIFSHIDGAVSGNFSGLPEGTIFPVGNFLFRINYHGGDGNDVILTCVESTISINDVAVLEGDSDSVVAKFTVTLSQPVSVPLSVKYATANGSAITPGDYRAVSGTVTIPAGQTKSIITVPIASDVIDEPDKAFFVNLSHPSLGTITDSQGRCRIVDNDVLPTLSIEDVTVTEGTSTGSTSTQGSATNQDAVFTVALSKASAKSVSVNAITTNGTAISPGDYSDGGKTLTFAPGEITKSFSVPIVDDALDEDSETCFVLLSSVTNARIVRGRGTCTIVDNDVAPSITVESVGFIEGNGGRHSVFIKVRLSSPSERVVKVSYATQDGDAEAGSDYDAMSPTQIAFAPGQTVALARVSIIGDTRIENEEYLGVTLNSPVNADIANSIGHVYLSNDDRLPSLSIGDAGVTEGNTGTKVLSFPVTLSSPNIMATSVNYATANGIARSTGDYVTASGTLTIPAGQTTATITVAINGDTVVEADETLFVLLTGNLNASIGKARGLGTIKNDDSSE